MHPSPQTAAKMEARPRRTALHFVVFTLFTERPHFQASYSLCFSVIQNCAIVKTYPSEFKRAI